jgi:hypothetical protein
VYDAAIEPARFSVRNRDRGAGIQLSSAAKLATLAASTDKGPIFMDIPERGSRPNSNPRSEESQPAEKQPQLSPETQEENRKIRRLQIMMNMVMSVISQEDMSVEEASELVANAKRAALAMFPDKELAYDLIYKPRLQRLMRERFRLQ